MRRDEVAMAQPKEKELCTALGGAASFKLNPKYINKLHVRNIYI